MSPNVNPLDTAKRQVKNSASQLRDCYLRSSYDFPQSPEHCSPTKYARVSRCSHGNVVMIFCPSFTQSERFLQTDQLIIRLQVVVVTNFNRVLMRNVFVNVFKSDAVIWWAVGRSTAGAFAIAPRFSTSCHSFCPLSCRAPSLPSSHRLLLATKWFGFSGVSKSWKILPPPLAEYTRSYLRQTSRFSGSIKLSRISMSTFTWAKISRTSSTASTTLHCAARNPF